MNEYKQTKVNQGKWSRRGDDRGAVLHETPWPQGSS